ncbi:hypothetical protein NPIRD3C_0275 [Nitrosopumilus piranensis]|uniref:Uncharacterized protein n=1 Tax=Nitrosopumilus piranensis TaxID=1582439 RepID=A0A0C5BP85_9ARCH|nr:hypothetical protein NPIRD3C_0275 [Nitrosopumilus piranensis]
MKIKGDSVILYLRNAPRTEPAARKINSNPSYLNQNTRHY